MTGEVWLLLTAGTTGGVARALQVALSVGVHGQALRRVDVPGAGSDLRESAKRAAEETLRILYRESYLDRQVVLRFDVAGPGTVQGRSAELAFALALAATAVSQPLPPVAATGTVEEGGAIGPVEGLEDKLAAALEVLPRGGIFVFPGTGEALLGPALRATAAERGITLLPGYRLEDVLARLGLSITHTWLENPFRGLEAFGFGDSSIFFGRGAEIESLAALLSKRGAVLLRGPSGAGKSSLVQAGLLPALMRREREAGEWRWGLLRPRDLPAPVGASAQQVEALLPPLAGAWCHDLEGGLGTAAAQTCPRTGEAEALVRWLQEKGAARPVLVIDQLEELFAPRVPGETAAALSDLLADLVGAGVALVCTMTNAALPELSKLSALSACFGVEGQMVLEPRHDAKFLQAVVSGPAAAAKLRFETGLDAELLAATSRGGSDVLPLLELLLTELFERREPATRELRWQDYRAVGGLDGVVSARAEAVFQSLAPEQRDAVARIVWRLVTLGVVDTGDFAPGDPIHAALSAFQSRRLLVRDATGAGDQLRAAHEALLRHWQRAQALVQSWEEDIALWRDLRREAGQWSAGQRSLVPSGPQLRAASSFVARRRGDFSPGDQVLAAYVAASLRQRDRRRVLAGLALGLPVAAAGGAGVLKLRDAYRASRTATMNFDDAPVPADQYKMPAAAFLQRDGIRLTHMSPTRSELAILKFRHAGHRGVAFFPKARPVATEAASRPPAHGMLTQITHAAADSLSFSLAFKAPVSAVRALPVSRLALMDAGLQQATDWELTPLDASGAQMRAASYRARRLPAADETYWFSVEATPGEKIYGVQISTYRHPVGSGNAAMGPAAEDFDGVHAVLLQEFRLFT